MEVENRNFLMSTLKDVAYCVVALCHYLVAINAIWWVPDQLTVVLGVSALTLRDSCPTGLPLKTQDTDLSVTVLDIYTPNQSEVKAPFFA